MFGEDDIVSIDVSFACRVMRSNVEMYVLCMITFIFVKIGDDKYVVSLEIGSLKLEIEELILLNSIIESLNSTTPLQPHCQACCGVASRQCVREYQFTHHRSRYSNKLLLGYAIDRWLH